MEGLLDGVSDQETFEEIAKLQKKIESDKKLETGEQKEELFRQMTGKRWVRQKRG